MQTLHWQIAIPNQSQTALATLQQSLSTWDPSCLLLSSSRALVKCVHITPPHHPTPPALSTCLAIKELPWLELVD